MNTEIEPKQTKKPVLLIDDSTDVRAFFETMAQIHSIPLITAHDGKDALEKLETLGTDPAVVFVDLNMPVMNGKEFLNELHERGLATSSHIVIFSGAEQNTFEAAGKSTEWLQKPFEMNDVLDIISKALHH